MTDIPVNPAQRKVDGLLFDKDGTLFDFHATWSAATVDLIEDLSAGDAGLRVRLAEALDFDLEANLFRPTSPVIAGTNREAAECMAPVFPDRSLASLEHLLEQFATEAAVVPAVPLAPLMGALREAGLALGVMTNDSEFGAHANLKAAGVTECFDMIIGFDSGFGAKPAPDPLLAFAKHRSLPPERVAIVGDSTHDLIAGRAAGMQTIAVLTGVAERADLAPYADVVLDDIGHIPGWLTV